MTLYLPTNYFMKHNSTTPFLLINPNMRCCITTYHTHTICNNWW